MMYLRATMTIIDAEEMDGRNLRRGSGTGSRTTTKVIARARHESRPDGNGVLHLLPSTNHGSEPPAYCSIIPSSTLVLPRRQYRQLVAQRNGIYEPGDHRFLDDRGRNLAGTSGDVARTSGASRIFSTE